MEGGGTQGWGGVGGGWGGAEGVGQRSDARGAAFMRLGGPPASPHAAPIGARAAGLDADGRRARARERDAGLLLPDAAAAI